MKATEARETALKKRKEYMKAIYEQIGMSARSGNFHISWSVDGGLLTEELNELIENGFRVDRDPTVPLHLTSSGANCSILTYKISWYPEKEYTR